LQQRTWHRAELLLIGAIPAPGRRTVTSLPRIAGLGRERRFTDYHRVLNRAAWDARSAARLLLGFLIAAFVPAGPVVLGIDDTIERRRGRRIAAKGVYRDPVRSSRGHFVKASGLPALAEPDAAGSRPLGRARLGGARRAGRAPGRARRAGPGLLR
jgi:hypothetical protein